MDFRDKLVKACQKNKSRLCIGLDPELQKIPSFIRENQEPLWAFNKALIENTIDLVCAYKPNLAFYEAEGIPGLLSLKKTIEFIGGRVPVILDAKRGDIGNTAKAYAQMAFKEMQADAVTLSPYMGFDSLEPFFSYKEKGSFILCLTSNPGAADFQKPELYKQVARKCYEWSKQNRNIGLVVGATNPGELKEIRRLAPGLVFLVPGIGAQGGDLQEVLAAGLTSAEDQVVINASRSIIYASDGKDFAKKAGAEADKLRKRINELRPIS